DRLGLELVGVSFSGFHFHSVSVAYRLVQKSSALHIDTLKIIAYRAETALSRLVGDKLVKHHRDEARAFVRDLYTTEANLTPDQEAGTLTVELYSLATPKANEILKHLCAELNTTET
ncbi:MAG: hypothetical protein ACI8T1_003977, partial [Verrucomicrobiales bacterium]